MLPDGRRFCISSEIRNTNIGASIWARWVIRIGQRCASGHSNSAMASARPADRPCSSFAISRCSRSHSIQYAEKFPEMPVSWRARCTGAAGRLVARLPLLVGRSEYRRHRCRTANCTGWTAQFPAEPSELSRGLQFPRALAGWKQAGRRRRGRKTGLRDIWLFDLERGVGERLRKSRWRRLPDVGADGSKVIFASTRSGFGTCTKGSKRKRNNERIFDAPTPDFQGGVPRACRRFLLFGNVSDLR